MNPNSDLTTGNSATSNIATGMTRRQAIITGGVGTILAAGIFPNLKLRANEWSSLPEAPRFTPFTQPLPIPGRLGKRNLSPEPGCEEARCGSAAVYHGIAPEFYTNHPAHHPDWDQKPTACHYMEIQHAVHQFVPGIESPCFAYSAGGTTPSFPGPTFRMRHGEPAVIRLKNTIDLETSLHHHGAHSPSHSDGHPVHYTFHGECRDYYYPNAAPRHHGEQDLSENPSTMWYHDHGNDVTAHNVAHGLCGFSLFTDSIEEDLISRKVLPEVDDAFGNQGAYDIPMAFHDTALNPDGTIYWDPLNLDGRIGNIFTTNGVAQPYLNVERRAYRFRFLCANLARVIELRLSNGQAWLQISNDSWLLPKAVSVSTIRLIPGKRADVIVDFSRMPEGTVLYIENIMDQDNGRKPNGVDLKKRVPFVKLCVVGKTATNNSLRIGAGTPLRPHVAITQDEIVATRVFELNRSNGAWQINKEFYNATRCDAQIQCGTAERWILRNNSGGWWHPLHIHVESHQIQKINGRAPKAVWAAKTDTSPLEDGTEIEIFMKFRTFCGPFVFHCHNNNHEDHRMMKQIEICGTDAVTGKMNPPMLNGSYYAVEPDTCGIPQPDIDANPHLFS
jgi:FtsP/CotA-like multicopper oxidase with cupredoxin domain